MHYIRLIDFLLSSMDKCSENLSSLCIALVYCYLGNCSFVTSLIQYKFRCFHWYCILLCCIICQLTSEYLYSPRRQYLIHLRFSLSIEMSLTTYLLVLELHLLFFYFVLIVCCCWWGGEGGAAFSGVTSRCCTVPNSTSHKIMGQRTTTFIRRLHVTVSLFLQTPVFLDLLLY